MRECRKRNLEFKAVSRDSGQSWIEHSLAEVSELRRMLVWDDGGGDGGDGKTIIGAAVAWTTLPGGEVRHDVWDHGELTQIEARERLWKAGGSENGWFLISSRAQGFTGEDGVMGEFWLTVFQGSIYHYPIMVHPHTKMLFAPKIPWRPRQVHPYDNAKTLPELVAALSKPDRADWWSGERPGRGLHLQHPAPSPESSIGGTMEPTKINKLLELYSDARNTISVPLVRAVLQDVNEYDQAAAKHTVLAGLAVMARLAAAATPGASESMALTPTKIAEMTADKKAPPPTALLFVLYSQRVAADVSIAAYNLICVMIDAVGVGGVCIPGGVKGSRRIIFKTLFKYGGLLSKCHDLSRLTIKVPTLAVMATLVEALHNHSELLVIRCKNRFDPEANADEAGGY